MTDHSQKLFFSLSKRQCRKPTRPKKVVKRTWDTFIPSDDLPLSLEDPASEVRQLPDQPTPVPRRLPALNRPASADNKSDEETDDLSDEDSLPVNSRLPFALETSATGLYAKSAVITRLVENRRERHIQATDDFKSIRAAIAKELEAEIGATARALKFHLVESTKNLRDDLAKLHKDEYLIEMEPEGFENVWIQIIDIFGHRESWISEFKHNMESLELNRQAMVENELSRLLERLVDIGFKIRVEIERDLEPWSQEINIEIIRNKGSYSELITMLKTKDLKLKHELKKEWEGRRETWQKLRHERVIDIFNSTINQDHWVNPQTRREMWNKFMQKQRDIDAKCIILLNELYALSPPDISQDEVQKISDESASTRLEAESDVENLFKEWDNLYKDYESQGENILANVKDDLLKYNHKSEEEIDAEIEEMLRPKVAKLREADRTLQRQMKDILASQDGRVHAKIERVISFYSSIVSRWNSFLNDVETLEKSVDSSIDSHVETFNSKLADLEKELKEKIDMVRHAEHREQLEEYWTVVEKILGPKGQLEDENRSHIQKLLELSDEHAPKLEEIVSQCSDSFCGLFGLSEPSDEPQNLYETAGGMKFELDQEFCKKICEQQSEEPPEEEPAEDENAEPPISPENIVDPNNAPTFEYLDFDLNRLDEGVSELRVKIMNGVEVISKAEIARAKKEYNFRREKYASELEIELRKLRPRLPLTKNDVFVTRENELETNAKRYSRHQRRCELLVSDSKRRFQRDQSQIMKLIEERDDLLQASLTGLKSSSDRSSLSILNKTLRSKSVEIRDDLLKKLDALEAAPVNLDTRVAQAQLQFFQGCILLSDRGTYSDHEIEMYEEKRSEIDNKAKETVTNEETQITELKERTSQFAADSFFESYKVKSEEIAMRFGLGQKYGKPKREFFKAMRAPNNYMESRKTSIQELLRKIDPLEDDNLKPCSALLKMWDLIRHNIAALGDFLGVLRAPFKITPMKYYITDEKTEDVQMEEQKAYKVCLEEALAEWKTSATTNMKQFYSTHGKDDVVASVDGEIPPETEKEMGDMQRSQNDLVDAWSNLEYLKLIKSISKSFSSFSAIYFEKYESRLMKEISKHISELNSKQLSIETKILAEIEKLESAASKAKLEAREECITSLKEISASVLAIPPLDSLEFEVDWDSIEEQDFESNIELYAKKLTKIIKSKLTKIHADDHRAFIRGYSQKVVEELCFIVEALLTISDTIVRKNDLLNQNQEPKKGKENANKKSVDQGADTLRSRFAVSEYSYEKIKIEYKSIFGTATCEEIFKPNTAFDYLVNDEIISIKERTLLNLGEVCRGLFYIIRADFEQFRRRY